MDYHFENCLTLMEEHCISKSAKLTSIIVHYMSLHFQTSVYVRYKQPDEGKNLLHGIRSFLLNWVVGKERKMQQRKGTVEKLKTRDFCDAFHNAKVDRNFISGSKCRTAVYKRQNPSGVFEDCAWGMQYRHKDTQPNAMRSWYTDVTIRKIADDICLLYIAISFRKSRYTLVEDTSVEIPKPSVPRFLKDLIRSPFYEVAFDEDFSSFANAGLVKVPSVSSLDLIYRYIITSSLRRHVVVLAYGGRIAPLAKRMAEGLMGKVTVLQIDSNDEVRKYLEQKESSLRVYYNGIRIFYPTREDCDVPRSQTFNQDVLATIMDEVICNLLSAYELRNPYEYKSIADVYHLISVAHFRQQLEYKKNRVEEHEITAMTLEEKLEKIQKDYDDLWKEYESCETEHEKQVQAYMDNVEQLKGEVARCKNYISKKEKDCDELEEKWNQSLNNCNRFGKLPYPSTLSGILRYLENVYKHRVVVHSAAYVSAEEFSNFPVRFLDKPWKMFAEVATTLYDMKFGTERENVVINEKEFHDVSGFEITMTEGRMTNRDASLTRLRELEYEGKTVHINAHVKWGTDIKKSFRLHVAFLEEEKKILIGHFGRHMDNRTTSSLK